jgi:hypothetical protein
MNALVHYAITPSSSLLGLIDLIRYHFAICECLTLIMNPIVTIESHRLSSHNLKLNSTTHLTAYLFIK